MLTLESLYKYRSDPNVHPLRVSARQAYRFRSAYEQWDLISAYILSIGSEQDVRFASGIYWGHIVTLIERAKIPKVIPQVKRIEYSSRGERGEWLEELDT